MADILTQLQTCLDQLATQFYATLGYLDTYHDHSPAIPPPNIPSANPQLAKIPKGQPGAPIPATAAAQAKAAEQASPPPQTSPDPNAPPPPDSPRTFAARQRELARDLIIKEQQIEYLIKVLPGIGSSEAEQEARIRELERELREVEAERERKTRELRVLGRRLENVLGTVERGIYGDEVPRR